MPTLYRYAQFASAVYEDTKESLIERLQKSGCSAWSVKHWQGLTSSNGFQGAILESDKEIVCVFKGSTFGKAFVDDWLVNDLLIAINALPPQMMAAYDMVVATKTACADSSKPISLVGHSLGGGLAQIIGHICALPFVTFNAPGMKGNAQTFAMLGGKAKKGEVRGFNMILWTDPVGNYGRHIGKTQRFHCPGAGRLWAGAAPIAHMMANVLLALEQSEWATKDLAQCLASA